jgi:hypothetical protein
MNHTFPSKIFLDISFNRRPQDSDLISSHRTGREHESSRLQKFDTLGGRIDPNFSRGGGVNGDDIFVRRVGQDLQQGRG